MTNEDLVFAIERLINSSQSAEGKSLPLAVKAGIRVPAVTNLKTTLRKRVADGTEFTLTWTEPEPLKLVSHYLITANDQNIVIGSYETKRSPVKIFIPTFENKAVTFTIRTVLTNGQISLLENSPSCSGIKYPV